MTGTLTFSPDEIGRIVAVAGFITIALSIYQGHHPVAVGVGTAISTTITAWVLLTYFCEEVSDTHD